MLFRKSGSHKEEGYTPDTKQLARENTLLEEIRSEKKPTPLFDNFYHDNFDGGVRLCLRSNLSNEDAQEVVNDSFIALFTKIRTGEIAEVTVSIRAYLYKIIEGKILNKYREKGYNKQKLTDSVEIPNTLPYPISSSQRDTDMLLDQGYHERLDLFLKTQKPCGQLLQLYCVDDDKEAALAFVTKNDGKTVAEDTLRKKVSRCRTELRLFLNQDTNHKP